MPSANDPAQQKKLLRAQLLEKMNAVSQVSRKGSSQEVLFRFEEFKLTSGIIISFQPLLNEPNLAVLNSILLSQGRLGWIDWTQTPPRLIQAEGTLDGSTWHHQPPGKEVASSAVAAILVPGVAFSIRGDRLGRGLGAYDRLSAAYPLVRRIGVGWAALQQQDLPLEPWDLPVHDLILI